LLPSSSCTGKRDVGTGDELCTIMDGVGPDSDFLVWVRSEFRRERERVSEVGGGDFKRGETGQWGVVSPELVPELPFVGRGTREGSCGDAGESWGTMVPESARWMAAAEGTVAPAPARLGPLFGLTSVLLLRERRPDLGLGPGWRCDWRLGDVSRDDIGEFVVDGPLSAFCRGARDGLSGPAAAAVGGGARFVEGSCVGAMG
jgi:hypothetical protein